MRCELFDGAKIVELDDELVKEYESLCGVLDSDYASYLLHAWKMDDSNTLLELKEKLEFALKDEIAVMRKAPAIVAKAFSDGVLK